MMFSELYQYLLLHKELPVPGIGTFLLERESARADFSNKQFLPPSYTVVMQPAGHLPEKNFFRWLSKAMGISDREAIFRFNDFAFDLKKQLSEGAVVNWNEVGELSRGLGGEVKFVPSNPPLPLEKPVPAEKVIREKAEHMVRVGEQEKTAAQMEEMLSQPEEKKSLWWAWALAVGLLATMFIGWYFSEHGVGLPGISNTSKLKAGKAPVTSKLLQ